MTCARDFAYHLDFLPSNDMAKAVLSTGDDYVICNECGTQFPVTEDAGKEECRVCDVRYIPSTERLNGDSLETRIHGNMSQLLGRRGRRCGS